MSFEPRPPVALFPRDVAAHWGEGDPRRHRLVVPAGALDQLDELPPPELADLESDPWAVTFLDGSTVEVLNLADRRRWLVRRAQCGFGTCACDAQAWPVDFTGEIPPPDVADAWCFYMTPEGWDALEVELGQPVGDWSFPELIAAVEAHRGQG